MSSMNIINTYLKRASSFLKGGRHTRFTPCLQSVLYGSAEFTMHCPTNIVFNRAKGFSLKEPETVKWLETNLRDDSVFWDIGSNVGVFSLFASALMPKCSILAFEPESQNYAGLVKNIALNKAANIQAHMLAISGVKQSQSFLKLHVSDLVTGGAVHSLGSKSPWFSGEVKFMQPVFACTIDELVENFKFTPPDLIKLDVDGIELDILEGGKRVLSQTTKTILLELDCGDAEQVQSMYDQLQSCGFTLSAHSEREHKVNGKTPRNYIWNKRLP